MTNSLEDVKRLKPFSSPPNWMYTVLLGLILFFYIKIGSIYSLLYSTGVALGISLPALLFVIIYNSIKGDSKVFKIISMSVTIGLLAILLIAQFAKASKGQLQGDITTITSVVSVIEGNQIRKEKKTGPVKNKEILLLKFSDNLISRHQQLVDDCTQRYRQIDNENNRKVDDILRSLRSSEGDKLFLINTTTNDFNDLTNNLSTACANRRTNLIFSEVVMKSVAGENGSYHFAEIPYGKYLLSVQHGLTYWFVPIEINQPVSQLNLSPYNAFIISQ